MNIKQNESQMQDGSVHTLTLVKENKSAGKIVEQTIVRAGQAGLAGKANQTTQKAKSAERHLDSKVKLVGEVARNQAAANVQAPAIMFPSTNNKASAGRLS